MAILNEFREAVKKNDKMLVRIMLKDTMFLDTTLKQFEEMLDYAETRMDGFYDIHDGEELVCEPEQWTRPYLSSQMVTLVDNFSKKRISLIKQMVRYYYPEKLVNESPADAKLKRQISRAPSGGRILSFRKFIGIVTALAGIIAAGAGVYKSAWILIFASIAGIIIGAGLILTDKG